MRQSTLALLVPVACVLGLLAAPALLRSQEPGPAAPQKAASGDAHKATPASSAETPEDAGHEAPVGPKAAARWRVGSVAFANSGAAAAQAAFQRGVALLHSFQYEQAADAFREAEKTDPAFAMAYWGEAMTYNHGVWVEQDSTAARAVLARLAATPEERSARAPTKREKDYLRALDVLYGAAGTKQARRRARAHQRAADRHADRVPTLERDL